MVSYLFDAGEVQIDGYTLPASERNESGASVPLSRQYAAG